MLGGALLPGEWSAALLGGAGAEQLSAARELFEKSAPLFHCWRPLGLSASVVFAVDVLRFGAPVKHLHGRRVRNGLGRFPEGVVDLTLRRGLRLFAVCKTLLGGPKASPAC